MRGVRELLLVVSFVLDGRAYDMIPMVVLQDFLLFVSLSSVIQPLDYFLPPRSNLTKHQRTPTDSRHTYQPC